MAFVYHPENQGLLLTSLRWSHTVWPHVFNRAGFWLFLLLHLFLWYSYRTGALPRELVDDDAGGTFSLSWADIQMVSSIIVFFQVFYTSQCYQRYLQLNLLINQAFRSSHRFCFELKVYTAGTTPNHVRLAIRWMRTNLIMFFLEIRNGPLQPDQLDGIVDIGLLKPMEASFLRSYSSAQRSLIMIDWIARVSLAAQELAPIKGPAITKALTDRILQVDEAQKDCMDIVRMPVPFQYFHLLNMMICINVALWAYGMAMTETIFGPISFFFTACIFIGMLELAKLFADPFGEDEVDFPLHIWLEKFLENQAAFIEYEYPDAEQNFASSLSTETKKTWDAKEIGAFMHPVGTGERNVLNSSRHASDQRSVTMQPGGSEYAQVPTQAPPAFSNGIA